MRVKAVNLVSGAVLAAVVSAPVMAAEDMSAVEDRIKPVGSVVVSGTAAPANQEAGMGGMSGMSGMSGMDGMSGMGGMSGMSGMDGMSGMGGMSGMSGMGGMSGMSGMDGMSGMGGMSGMSGMDGMSGMGGMSGMSGMSGMAGGGDATALATASGCMACHQLEAKVVGPSLKEVAAKYKGGAGARDALIAKVKNGGVGSWGQVPMPPNAHIADADIATLVDWILSM